MRAVGEIAGELVGRVATRQFDLIGFVAHVEALPAEAQREVMLALLERFDRDVLAAWLPACVELLDAIEDGPALSWGDLRGEARFFAETCSGRELEVYLAALCERAEARLVAAEARKRALVAIWQSLDEGDRRRFLQRVDPRGAFLKAG